MHDSGIYFLGTTVRKAEPSAKPGRLEKVVVPSSDTNLVEDFFWKRCWAFIWKEG